MMAPETLTEYAVHASEGQNVDSAVLVEVKKQYETDRKFANAVNERIRQSGSLTRFSRALEEAAEEAERQRLLRFHRQDKNGRPTGVFDYEVAQDIIEKENLLVVGGIPYIYEHGVFRPDVAGTKLFSKIRERIYPEFQRAQTEKRIYDFIIRTDSIQADADDLNRYPAHWVNFRNGMFDPLEWKIRGHSPIYKSVNQIPYIFDPENLPKGETLTKWLAFIAPNSDDREMLLQYFGYTMTPDTRQQKFLILFGPGGTGKSTLIRLLEAVIGRENISHISLRELTQRFSSFGLMGKLLNSCADLEVSALEDTSTLKKVLGEDTIRVEAKGKDAVSIRSYAKLIFSTNELPLVLNEKTNGFYRRLLVLNMNQTPPDTTPDFFEKLEAEAGCFIYLCMMALQKMLRQKTITESVGSKRAVMELRKDSDTVEAWICDTCTFSSDARVDRVQLYRSYERYCDESERTALSKNGFYRALRVKGYQERKTEGVRKFIGIQMGKAENRGSFPGQISVVKHEPAWEKIPETDVNPFEKNGTGAT